MNFPLWATLSSALLFLFSPVAPGLAQATDALTVNGFVAARLVHVKGPAGWIEGASGALVLGDADRDATTYGRADAHVVIDWQPSTFFGALVHATGREEPSESEGRATGIVEAYVYSRFDLGRSRSFELKLGHFILPTSLENPDIAWASPYTLTFSALNSWIGEEIRPTGLWAGLTLPVGSGTDELRFGASVFGGNDTSGALLAWRGFAMHDRLSVHGEFLPLPPLPSLEPGGGFATQDRRGTQPFTSDLDDRLGWVAQVKWQRFERASIVLTHYDNRADRELYDGQYAWENDFDHLAVAWHSRQGSFSLLAEGFHGTTGMGLHEGPFYIQTDYRAAYALASWTRGRWRLSARYDDFETEDLDSNFTDLPVDEAGGGWTFAAFWEANAPLRLGIECLDLDVSRDAAASLIGDRQVGGRSLQLEARFYVDWPALR